MSGEKQIEEMAKCCTYYHNGECCANVPDISECDLMCEIFGVFANLTARGYRKQSDVVRCKDCEHYYQVGDVRICRHWNYHSTKDDAYCSFAKMKGGAE